MKNLRTILSALVLIASSIWLVWYVRNHWEHFRVIADVRPAYLLLMCAVFIPRMVCNGLFTRIAMLAYGVKLPAREWLGLAFLTAFFNQVLPLRAGAGLRAAYLRARHDFPLTYFVSTFSAMYIIMFLVYALLGLIAMALLRVSGEGFSAIVAIVFGGIVVLSIVALAVPFNLPAAQTFPFRELSQISQGWEILRRNTRLLAALTGSILVFALISAIQYRIAFSALNIEISPLGTLLYVSAAIVAMMISLTPASLGIAEAVAVYMGTILNYTPAEALMVQGLIRGVSFIVLAISSPIASRMLGLSLKEIRKLPPPEPGPDKAV